MKNVVAYIRVSTDGQVGEDKFGMDSQKSIIMDYCSKHDMQISEWYVDEGESGVKESRPAFDRLLFGEVSNPPVTAVIVAKSDRIARDIKLYFYYMFLLEKKSIELISATEEVVNDDTGLGNVYKSLMLFVAEQERKNINKRTSGGRAVKAAQGGYAGGSAPYGYRVDNGRLVVVPEEAEWVRYIFSARDAGETMWSICNKLNSEGVKTHRGKNFAPATISAILDNKKVYEGYYKYGKNADWVKGEQEAIM